MFLEGKLIHVVRRGAPTVRGNGRSTVRELIQSETARRLSATPIRSLHPLDEDLDCAIFLRREGKSPRTVPTEGEVVPVKGVVNQNASDDNTVVEEPVHESLLTLGADISRTLQLQLMALDVLTDDLSADLSVTGGCVNEINAQPGLHHHYLVSNPGPNGGVSATILDYTLRHGAPISHLGSPQ